MLGTMMAVLLLQYCDDHCLQWLRVFGHLLKRELFELHPNVLWSLAMLQMMMTMMMISPAPSWVLPSVRKCRCAKKVSGREMVIRFSHNYSWSDCTSNWSLSHCSENIVFTLPSKSRTEYHRVILVRGVERSKIIFSNLFPLWECFEEGGDAIAQKGSSLRRSDGYVVKHWPVSTYNLSDGRMNLFQVILYDIFAV